MGFPGAHNCELPLKAHFREEICLPLSNGRGIPAAGAFDDFREVPPRMPAPQQGGRPEFRILGIGL